MQRWNTEERKAGKRIKEAEPNRYADFARRHAAAAIMFAVLVSGSGGSLWSGHDNGRKMQRMSGDAVIYFGPA